MKILVQGACFEDGYNGEAPVSNSRANVWEVLRQNGEEIFLSATFQLIDKNRAFRYAGEMAMWHGCDVEDKTFD